MYLLIACSFLVCFLRIFTIMDLVPIMSDCTIELDGKILDSKDIDWYKDIDSAELIQQTVTLSSTTTSSSTNIPLSSSWPSP